jgi:hypothetical protein
MKKADDGTLVRWNAEGTDRVRFELGHAGDGVDNYIEVHRNKDGCIEVRCGHHGLKVVPQVTNVVIIGIEKFGG